MRALLCIAVILATGCTARVYSTPVPVQPAVVTAPDDDVVYVDTVPAHIEAYPRYYYGGRYSYYAYGRWYVYGPRGWAYYRRPPPPLVHRYPYPPPPGVVERQR
jgi:hypothetical protein